MKKIDQISVTWAFKSDFGLNVVVPASGNRRDTHLLDLHIVSDITCRSRAMLNITGKDLVLLGLELGNSRYFTPELFPEVISVPGGYRYCWRIDRNTSFTTAAMWLGREILFRLKAREARDVWTLDRLLAGFVVQKRTFVWFGKHWETFESYLRYKHHLPPQNKAYAQLPRSNTMTQQTEGVC